VAVDGSAGSDAALDWAILEARAKGSELLLVHVLTTSDELAMSLLPLAGAPDAQTFGNEVLERAASKCEQSAVPHSAEMVEGSPAQRLVAISGGAGMLVLGGRHHDRPPPPGFESVIHGCLHRCRCPFVVVKEDLQ
jgi:nucleotide-binding universal stress UspA family protein